jgi:hypothetical protein
LAWAEVLPINALSGDLNIPATPPDSIGSDVAIFNWDSDEELAVDINIAAITFAATSIGSDLAIAALQQ